MKATAKTRPAAARLVRLRAQDHAALLSTDRKAPLERRRELPDLVHEVIGAGVAAILGGWEPRLAIAERRARVLEAFSRRVLATLHLSAAEAGLVAISLRETALAAGQMGGMGVSPELVRADLVDGVRVVRPTDKAFDRDEFLERIKAWTPGDLVAVLTGVERFWELDNDGKSKAALVASGLIAANLGSGDAR